MRDTHGSQGRPVLESLESRLLLSGDLTITDTGGNLRIVGDENPNQITITQDGNTVTVTPDDGETINGVAGPADFTLTRGVSIRMGDGNDVLVLAGVAARQMRIDAGRGDNQVTLTGLNPDGPGGAADLQTIIDRNLTIVTRGNGDDLVMLEGVDVGGNAHISLAGGLNMVGAGAYVGVDAAFGSSFNGLTVLGRGISQIVITDATIQRRLKIFTGSGNDTLTLTGVQTTYIAIMTRGGDDTVVINGGVANPTTDVTRAIQGNLGSGDDLLNLGNINARGIYITGGPGSDTIDDNDATVLANIIREINFENGVD